MRQLSLIIPMVTLILAMLACGGLAEHPSQDWGVSEAEAPLAETHLSETHLSELAYNDGWDAGKKGGYREAISHYNKAIELDPDYIDAYINRGYAYDELGEYQTAITDYTKAIELDPDNALAYVNRGYDYDELGEYQNALEDYDKTIELDPDYGLPYLNRGVTLQTLGKIALASEDFNKACELDRSLCHPKDESPNVNTLTPTESPSAPSQPTHVDLRGILDLWNSNEVAADAKYKGMYVVMEGVIETVTRKEFRIYPLVPTSDYLLAGADLTGALMGVADCKYSSNQQSDIVKLRKGQSVTVVGTLRTLDNSNPFRYRVEINPCMLSLDIDSGSATPTPTPVPIPVPTAIPTPVPTATPSPTAVPKTVL